MLGRHSRLRAPPYVCVPTVVIAVVFIVVMPVDSDASGAVPPTIPSKMVLPLPVLVQRIVTVNRAIKRNIAVSRA